MNHLVSVLEGGTSLVLNLAPIHALKEKTLLWYLDVVMAVIHPLIKNL